MPSAPSYAPSPAPTGPQLTKAEIFVSTHIAGLDAAAFNDPSTARSNTRDLTDLLFSTIKKGIFCEAVQVVSVSAGSRRSLEARRLAASALVKFLVTTNTANNDVAWLSAKMVVAINFFILSKMHASTNPLLQAVTAFSITGVGVPTTAPTAAPSTIPTPGPSPPPTSSTTPAPRWTGLHWTLQGIALYGTAGGIAVILLLCSGYLLYFLGYCDKGGRRLPRKYAAPVVPVETPPWGDDCLPQTDSPKRRKKPNLLKAMGAHSVQTHIADDRPQEDDDVILDSIAALPPSSSPNEPPGKARSKKEKRPRVESSAPRVPKAQQCKFHYDGDVANQFLCGIARCDLPRLGEEGPWSNGAVGGESKEDPSSPSSLPGFNPSPNPNPNRYCERHDNPKTRKLDAAGWSKPDFYALYISANMPPPEEGSPGEQPHRIDASEGGEDEEEGEKNQDMCGAENEERQRNQEGDEEGGGVYVNEDLHFRASQRVEMDHHDRNEILRVDMNSVHIDLTK